MKKAISILLVFAMLVSLSACGNQTGTPSQQPTQSSSANPSESNNPGTSKEEYIIIGNIQDLSGGTAVWGNSYKYGADYAAELINEAGGINGKKVKVITYDCAGDVTQGINAFNRLADEDKAVAVMGLISNIGLALTGTSEEKKVPMVTDFMDERCTTNPETGEAYPYMFLTEPSCNQQAVIMAGYSLENLNAKRGAVLFDQTNAYTASHAEPFKEYFNDNGGEIVAFEAFNGTEKDYRAQLSKIKSANPDVLFICGYTQQNALAYQQARAMGIDCPIVGNNSFCTPFASLVGDSVKDVFYPNNVNYENEEIKKVVDRYKNDNKGADPSYHVFFGFDNVNIIKDAIERAGTTEGEALAKALEQTKDLECLTGKISIDPETHRPSGLSMWIYEVVGTEYEPRVEFIPKNVK